MRWSKDCDGQKTAQVCTHRTSPATGNWRTIPHRARLPVSIPVARRKTKRLAFWGGMVEYTTVVKRLINCGCVGVNGFGCSIILAFRQRKVQQQSHMPLSQTGVESTSQPMLHHAASQNGWHSLILPVWLFVIGHRPLAFLVGQALFGLAPLAALLGDQHVANAAHRLSEPNGAQSLEKWLADRLQS